MRGSGWPQDGNKKGDFLVRLNRPPTRGHDLRIVLEAKDQPKTEHGMLAELDQAFRNRDRPQVGAPGGSTRSKTAANRYVAMPAPSFAS